LEIGILILFPAAIVAGTLLYGNNKGSLLMLIKNITNNDILKVINFKTNNSLFFFISYLRNLFLCNYIFLLYIFNIDMYNSFKLC